MTDPQTFYIVKGVFGVGATLLLLVHMNGSWRTFDRDSFGVKTGIGQRMRFMSLFFAAVLISAASLEQVQDLAEISKRNVGGLGFVLFLIATAIVSIIEARRINLRRH